MHYAYEYAGLGSIEFPMLFWRAKAAPRMATRSPCHPEWYL